MAFKLKGILNKNVAPALKKNNADIKKMQKLDDEIAKARKLGNKGVVQVLVDKKSKLEDTIMGTNRPDPTFEGTDEFRKKKDIPKSERKEKGVLRKNGNDKKPPRQPNEGPVEKRIYINDSNKVGGYVSEDELESKFSKKGGNPKDYPQLSVQDYSTVKKDSKGKYVVKL
jgi:hypothetical protein